MTRMTDTMAQQQKADGKPYMRDIYASVLDALSEGQQHNHQYQIGNPDLRNTPGRSYPSSSFLETTTSRGRGASSLDYKLPPGSSKSSTTLARPNKGSPSTTAKTTADQQQQTRRTRHQQFKTRARGSSGLPPRKVTLEELAQMDQETFLKALYDDPELAQAVAQEHAKEQQQKAAGAHKMKRSHNMKSQREDSKHRTRGPGSSSPGKEKPFLNELKKDGVPVVQWTVLIVILAVTIYQLYKLLAGPQAKGKPPHGTRGSAGGGGGGNPAQRKKSKQSKAKQLSQTVPAVEEKVVAELKDAVVSTAEVDTSKQKKKTGRRIPKTKTSNNKQKTSSNSTKQKAKQQEADPVPAAKVKSIPFASDPTPSLAHWEDGGEQDQGEWQTVPKRADSTAKQRQQEEQKPENGASMKVNGTKKPKKKKADRDNSDPSRSDAPQQSPPPPERSAPVVSKTAENGRPSEIAENVAPQTATTPAVDPTENVQKSKEEASLVESKQPESSVVVEEKPKSQPAVKTNKKEAESSKEENKQLDTGDTENAPRIRQEDENSKEENEAKVAAVDQHVVGVKKSGEAAKNGISKKDSAKATTSEPEIIHDGNGQVPTKAIGKGKAGKTGAPKTTVSEANEGDETEVGDQDDSPQAPLMPPVSPAATKNDALLALELQTQEEELAKKEAAEAAAAEAAANEQPQPGEDDVWEEVTVRRRRSNRPVPNTPVSVPAPPVATTAPATLDDEEEGEEEED